jgi:hypothetical protein
MVHRFRLIIRLAHLIGCLARLMDYLARSNAQVTINFSPKVHMLAGALVPVVSTNTWWIGG